MGTLIKASDECEHQLRYRSLFNEGRGFAFPCDADGHVDLASLSERGRTSYCHVRSLVGREYSAPFLHRTRSDVVGRARTA